MNSKLSHLCDALLEAGWLVAIIATPLFFNIHSERVFEPDKIALLRSIALAMTLVWIVKFIDQQGWKDWGVLRWNDENSIWRRPFILPIVALVLVYFVSTVFSITPRISLLGSYQRLQGTYTTLSYIFIFAIAIDTIRTRVQINRIVTAVIITSIPVAFYALLQHYGLDPLPWGGDVKTRVAGHLGNAIFIAAYLIMAVPLTLGRIVDAFTNILSDEQMSIADVIRSAVYIFTLVIQLLAIYWSGSRGPLIGLAVALFSFILLLLVTLRNAAGDQGRFQMKDALWAFLLVVPSIMALFLSSFVMQALNPLAAFIFFFGVVILSIFVLLSLVAARIGWKWLWLSWLLLTTFVAGWLLLFNVPTDRTADLQQTPLVGGIFQTQAAWKELPTIGSYGRMLDPSQTVGRERSNRVRVLIWEGVMELISPHEPISFPDGREDRFNFLRPLIGYGPESMYVVYNRFYPPELATVEARNASPDRSHNETFDALVITGLFGFFAWQALYLSVFYYGFSYLGVVVTRRDRNFLLGAWIGGAFIGAVLSFTILDPIYLGVAIPTGTIIGLIAYLFYYALFAKPANDALSGIDRRGLPFQTDRLLMNALLAAIIAHYVEIHFGIAIAATRTHFFLFVALMYAISYKLPLLQRAAQAVKPAAKRQRDLKLAKESGDGRNWGPLMLWTFLLALMVGILGFEFMNYTLPPDYVVESGTDLFSSDIFRQSLFLNVQREFRELPFIYLLILLSWLGGFVLTVAEMVKQGELDFTMPEVKELPSWRRSGAVAVTAVWALVAGLLRFVTPSASSATAAIGQNLALLGAVIALWAGVSLLVNRRHGRFIALTFAVGGVILSGPVLIAGGLTFGLFMAGAGLLILFLLWDPSWRPLIIPPGIFAALSLGIGMLYTYLHAVSLREGLLFLIFYQGIEPVSPWYTLFFSPSSAVGSVVELRLLEAMQSLRFLSSFYIFLFGMWVFAAVSLSWRQLRQTRLRGSVAAYAGLAATFLIGIMLITQTNLRVVQADVIYKRAKPFDQQALQMDDRLSWDVAIKIYEEALELAPLEDFYFLFLGRALLERSALAETPEERNALLNNAQNRLFEAQLINPLNTDHTANLARLETRWVASNPEAEDRSNRLAEAEKYYQDAIALSPQNSVIRNEYANLALNLKGDCDQAIASFQESVEIDPFYIITYYSLAETLITCASAQSDEGQQQILYKAAIDSLEAAMARNANDARAWLQLGQLYYQTGQPEQALEAYGQAKTAANADLLVPWNVDFLEASAHSALGDVPLARALAEQALLTAPAEAAAQIESFLAGLPQN